MSEYEFTNGNTVVTNSKGERHRVANFNANILEEYQRIDGRRVDRTYIIEGKNENGDKLARVEVSAEDFATMNWVPQNWGSQAIIFPTPSSKEGLRTAIQVNSEPAVTRVYTHTGWSEIDGKWTFLANDVCIDRDGPRTDLNVDIPQDLARYSFPSKPSTGPESLNASLQLPSLFGKELGYLLLASVFRAPLGSDFAVHVTGRTGTFKSEVASCAQSHFGECTARELPASWSSTANALEAVCYRTKDAMIVVDDFIPVGTSYQQRAYQTSADRLVRGAGNQAGRARLTEVSGHQETMFPRGLILSTGEDTPEGHSVRGRMMITEISPGDIDASQLTVAQKNRPQYNAGMAGFLQWAAGNLNQLRSMADEVSVEVRDANLQVGHSRTPAILGKLVSGLWALSEYAKSMKMSEAVYYGLLDEGTEALTAIASRQHSYLEASDPADQFINVLRGIFGANAGHIKARNGGIPKDAIQLGWVQVGDDGMDWKPHGPRLGWEVPEDNTVYLDAAVVYDTIRRHSRGAITLTRNTLYKRLREAGHLVKTDATRQRNTVRVQLENATRTVIALNLETLLTKELE